MKMLLIILFLTISSCSYLQTVNRIEGTSHLQTVNTIEGTVVNNTETGTWEGVYIPRSKPTKFTYKNNSVTSANYQGYMLQAGDEGVGSNNNNLNGEILTGNKFTWNGTDMTSITHGVFTGYNINAVIKYNYLNKVPMGIIRKSNGMTNTSGGVAYNIIISPNVGIVMKGMNSVNIYNNTFYSIRTLSDTWRGLIDIYANDGFTPPKPSTGTKVFNNIFYTKYQIANINIYEYTDTVGFRSDYNVFYCESGTPLFKLAGVSKTFAQWQTLGYDLHSKVINPNFINFTDFVPTTRLDYGTNLGTIWDDGLSIDAVWSATDPENTSQNGRWQVGARILK